MGRSTAYYKSHPEARKKKNAKTAEINKRPSQKAKRRELGRKNYAHDKAHGKNSRNGKDFDHAVGRYVSSSTNRGRTNGTKGDNKARKKGTKHNR